MRLFLVGATRGQFQDTKIRPEDLDQLLDAARWAPSPFNVQPWELLIIREIEGKIALADLTEECVADQFKDTQNSLMTTTVGCG